MDLAITILVGIALVVFALVGYLRDLRRSVIAIAGTLLGAILVDFWAPLWGQSLATSLSSDNVLGMQAIISILVLTATTLIVGYGGGTLLMAAKDKPAFATRLAGGLLGLFNGALVLGYLLLYITANNPALLESLRSGPVGIVLIDGLPWLFLVIALLITLFVLVRFALRLASAGRAPAPVKADPKPAALNTPPATPIEKNQAVLDKINQKVN